MADQPFVFEPEVFSDERGHLYEAYHQDQFDQLAGRSVRFVQDNHSHSGKGVMRGLHYQLPPHAQGKLVRVVSGAIFDVAVDVRRSSPSFGSWFGEELSASNRRQMWVPPGFAHGFLVLSESTEVVYKLTDHHHPSRSRTIHWQDPDIGIDWPHLDGPVNVSERDADAPTLGSAEVFD